LQSRGSRWVSEFEKSGRSGTRHPYERFRDVLRAAGISAVADLRSAPSSRRFPQFNADNLRLSLRDDDLAYLYFGRELGGRPTSQALYRSDVVE
jgi:hypothetical protein